MKIHSFLLVSVTMVIFGGKWLSQMWLFGFPIPDLFFWTSLIFAALKLIFREDHPVDMAQRKLTLFNLTSYLILFFLFLKIILSFSSDNQKTDGAFFILRDSAPFIAIASLGYLNRLYNEFEVTVFHTSFKYIFYASSGAAISSIFSLFMSNGEGYPILESVFSTPILQLRSDQIAYALIPYYFFILNKFFSSKEKNVIYLFIFIITLFALPLKLTSRATLVATFFALLMCLIYWRKQINFFNTLVWTVTITAITIIINSFSRFENEALRNF